jgi:hypothetical protein
MMAGAGGAMRATGWRATAIRFQQFGERTSCSLSPDFSAGALAVFIPWRVGTEESGAAN